MQLSVSLIEISGEWLRRGEERRGVERSGEERRGEEKRGEERRGDESGGEESSKIYMEDCAGEGGVQMDILHGDMRIDRKTLPLRIILRSAS